MAKGAQTPAAGAKTKLANYKKAVTSKTAPATEEEGHGIAWKALVLFIALLASFVNSQHLAQLYENDRHFSHLADFEREMAYRTEMGLYFSYYKTLITAPTFSEGLRQITRDNVTEYGHTINTLKRFNLYPEVILGFSYRQFRAFADSIGWRVETCWQVNRGDNLKPVQSCEGIGNSHYFYITGVFHLAGLVAGAVFLNGVVVSDSILGGLVSVFCLFFNHGEATRVQWTPPLRESFSYPLIILQCALVSWLLKTRRSGSTTAALVAAPTTLAMLFWQFAPFAFFTQVVSLVGVFLLDLIPFPTMKTLLLSHLLAFISAFAMLFGNEMLLTSLYFSSILAAMLVLFLDRPLALLSSRPLHLLVSTSVFFSATLGLKIAIGKGLQVEDDAHIFDILRSKFTEFANFHTRLYTCAAEFDFLPKETLLKLSFTLLVPTALAGVVVVGVNLLTSLSLTRKAGDDRAAARYAECVYSVAQLVCFSVMAGLIMRLKLFFTPHLCVVAAIVVGHKILRDSLRIELNTIVRIAIAGALIAAMGYEGTQNISKQLSIQGEYSNPDQEMLFDWINENADEDAVFAGTMPVMANVKLSTGRPIVNHPHYEDVGIRERTLKVYSMFSRKPIHLVHATLREMGVEYFVFQPHNCQPHPHRPECSYRSMWDEEEPTLVGRQSLCDLFGNSIRQGKLDKIRPFSVVYNQRNYVVFQL